MVLDEEPVAVGKRIARVEVDHLVSEDPRAGDERRQQAVSGECDEDERADGKRGADAGSGPRPGHALSTTCESAGPTLCCESLYKRISCGAGPGPGLTGRTAATSAPRRGAPPGRRSCPRRGAGRPRRARA